MNIEVTRDNVTILEQSETPHENEYKITTCYFTFDEFTSSFQVKRAIFTILSTGEMYETDIINNQCGIPSEVLKHEYETVKLGVYGYNIGDNEELLNRFSPSYAEIVVPTGSYKEGALSPEPITPSQYDLYSQALQEGLQEVDDKLEEVDSKITEVDDKLDTIDDKIVEVDTAITETNNLDLDVSDKVDGDVTVTLTKKDASTKSVLISDGTSLQFMWQGTSLGIKTDDMQEYVFVDLQGIQGVPGPQGEPFRIKKTYNSVAEMNADFNNMEYGDYVMIASTVEVEDNAKLYTRGEREWIFITDFSGATGIKGETGATPNIQIGTVTSGSVPSVTRTGTNENPVLNFVLQPGEKGNTGDTGATGNGIASITKTSTTGLVDTYTITFTDGNTTTFNVENGNGIDHISLTSQSGATKVYTIYYTDGTTSEYTVQDGEVTQEVFDEEIERANMIYNAMPKVSGEGTDLTLDNTAECPVYDIELSPSELEQESTTGKNIFNPALLSQVEGYNTYDSSTGLWTTSSNGAYGRSILYNATGLQHNVDTTKVIKVKPSTTYTLKFYDFTISSGINCSVHYCDSLGTWLSDDNFNTTPLTFTTPENCEYIDIIRRDNTGTLSFSKIQIEEGNTATSWEPFTNGASPNPQYPQEIHTVSGENTVVVGNKNLLSLPDLIYGGGSNLSYNITDETITLTQTGSSAYSYKKFMMNLDINKYKGKTLHFSCKVDNNSSRGLIGLYDENKNGIGNLQASSITIPNDTTATYIGIQLYQSYATGVSGSVTFSDLIVTLSSNTDYVKHQEQTYPLSLGDLEYCKIGDYEDLFFKNVVGSEYYDSTLELNKWYLKKNIGKVVLDGSESYGEYEAGDTSNYYAYYTIINDTVSLTNVSFRTLYSNNYNETSWYDISTTKRDIPNIALRGSNYHRLYFRTSQSTKELFQEWLSEHNTIVYYILDNPTYTLLSDTLQTQLDNIQKAITYQEQTNVSQTNNDLPFVIKLSAIRDLSGIFELIQ